MSGSDRRNGVCGQIDEEYIDLHCMGRLKNDFLREHLESCAFCKERVAEHRSWIEDLKKALAQHQKTEDVSSAKEHADVRSCRDES